MTSTATIDFGSPQSNCWIKKEGKIETDTIAAWLWVSDKTKKHYYHIRNLSPNNSKSDVEIYIVQEATSIENPSSSAHCPSCQVLRNAAMISGFKRCSLCHTVIPWIVNSKTKSLPICHNRGFTLFVTDKPSKSFKVTLTLTRPLDSDSEFYSPWQELDFHKLFNSKDNHDVVLRSNKVNLNEEEKSRLKGFAAKVSSTNTENKLYASRAVLSSNTTFFKNMFISGLSESSSKEVVISSCTFECFKAIVYFIYTHDFKPEFIENTKYELWSEIIEVAQEWGMTKLAKIALLFASIHITPNNSFKLLQDCQNLKENGDIHKVVFSYILSNWSLFIQLDPLEI